MVGLFTVNLLADFLALAWVGMSAGALVETAHPGARAHHPVRVDSAFRWLFAGWICLADLFFILWGVTKLQQDFRWVLARQYR